MPITLPLQVVLEGNYIKGKDGMDRVEASYGKPESVPSDNKDCPPVQKSLSASLTMHKKRTK
jgi:hypothetical protein